MSGQTASTVLEELEGLGSPEVAAVSQRFFKTGKGQYGEGDHFLGIKLPVQRRVAKAHRDLPLAEITKLLYSTHHEARLVALLIMVAAFGKADERRRKDIFDLYLAHTDRVNNWDLVDSSAPNIVGAHLGPGKHALLTKLARSESLWERRIAILATLHFIKQDYFDETLRLAHILVSDTHDLIHKATGWMLREVGNRNRSVLEAFLQDQPEMPRTMLRYAIEKFPEGLRQRYLARGATG